MEWIVKWYLSNGVAIMILSSVVMYFYGYFSTKIGWSIFRKLLIFIPIIIIVALYVFTQWYLKDIICQQGLVKSDDIKFIWLIGVNCVITGASQVFGYTKDYNKIFN